MIGGVSNVLLVTEITGAYSCGRPSRMASTYSSCLPRQPVLASSSTMDFTCPKNSEESFFKRLGMKISAQLSCTYFGLGKEMIVYLFPNLIRMNSSKNMR